MTLPQVLLTGLGLLLVMPAQGCTNLKEGEQSRRFGPSLTVFVGSNRAKWYPEHKKNNYKDIPQMVIETLTPVECNNTSDNKFTSSHCALSQDVPLPEKIVFRYGKWISPREERRLFPPLSQDIKQNAPDVKDYDTIEQWREATNAYHQAAYSLPKYQAIKKARSASKEAIDWHTYTFYPREVMKKYDNLSPYNAMRTSIVQYRITFNPDMTVTTHEYLRYLDPAVFK